MSGDRLNGASGERAIEVPPYLAVLDIADVIPGDAEPLRDGLLCQAAGPQGTNLAHLLRVQLLNTEGVVPTLPDRIENVVALGAELQMVRIRTPRVVAGVHDDLPSRDALAVRLLPRKDMGADMAKVPARRGPFREVDVSGMPRMAPDLPTARW